MRVGPCLLLLALSGILSAAGPATPAGVFSDAEWDQAQRAAAPSAAGSGPSPGAAVAGIIGSLVVVVGVVAGLGYGVKRLGVRRLVAGRGRHLQVIETVPIALKRQVGLVRIGDQVVLVGIGEHELCHLGTLPATVLEAGTPDRPAEPAAPAGSSAFQQVLARLGKGRP